MTETKTSGFNPNYAVPPGAILEEWLDEHAMTQTDLAGRMGRPIKTINEIIKGKTAITQETALQLEAVTGVEASFWTNADRIYQERAARLEEEARLAEWADWPSRFPFACMVRHGWLAEVEEGTARVRALLRYFGVASPDAWEQVYGQVAVAYRKAKSFKSDPAHLGAWMRHGEVEGAAIECAEFDEGRFKSALGGVRKATGEDIKVSWPHAVKTCAEAGVALVVVPELPKTHVSGATRWLSSSKALIQLSLRYKSDDHLWFTFFHEAAHVLLHGKKAVIVECENRSDPREKAADAWAGDFLIPPRRWRAFVAARAFGCPSIRSFAASMGIAPGIVVGRLQHEHHLPFSACNELKCRLTLTAS